MRHLVGAAVVGEDHLVGAVKVQEALRSPLGKVPECGLKIIIKIHAWNKCFNVSLLRSTTYLQQLFR